MPTIVMMAMMPVMMMIGRHGYDADCLMMVMVMMGEPEGVALGLYQADDDGDDSSDDAWLAKANDRRALVPAAGAAMGKALL